MSEQCQGNFNVCKLDCDTILGKCTGTSDKCKQEYNKCIKKCDNNQSICSSTVLATIEGFYTKNNDMLLLVILVGLLYVVFIRR